MDTPEGRRSSGGSASAEGSPSTPLNASFDNPESGGIQDTNEEETIDVNNTATNDNSGANDGDADNDTPLLSPSNASPPPSSPNTNNDSSANNNSDNHSNDGSPNTGDNDDDDNDNNNNNNNNNNDSSSPPDTNTTTNTNNTTTNNNDNNNNDSNNNDGDGERGSIVVMVDDETGTVDSAAIPEDSTSSWEKAFAAKERDTFYLKYIDPWVNKGSVSNLITFFVFLLGLVLTLTRPEKEEKRSAHTIAAEYILSLGLFGFAGGITNWLAVKMLFDKVPGLYGSGVIPARFREIRAKMKSVIMDVFFDVDFLTRYITSKGSEFMESSGFAEKLNTILSSDRVDALIDAKLTDLAGRPEGMFLAMMAIDVTQLKPMIKPFVASMATDAAPLLLSEFSPGGSFHMGKVREQVDELLETKLQELSPYIVKRMMEEVIRDHLGWLVVWGNVFGGIIGVVSLAAGYGG